MTSSLGASISDSTKKNYSEEARGELGYLVFATKDR